jgi:hypothetical protein
MLNARSRAVLARLAVDLTIFVTDSSFLAGDVTIGSAILSGTRAEFVEGAGCIVESRFRACFLASCFGFEDEEDLEGDSPTRLVSVSTFRFFFGGDFGCSGAPLESNDDLGFEEDFNSVPGFSA